MPPLAAKTGRPGFARGKTGQPRFARVEAAAGPDGPGRQGFCPGSADASRTGSGLPPSGGMKHRCAGEVRRPYGRHFICRLWRRKPSQPGFARGKQADLASLEVMHSPFGGWRHHLSAPLGSVSLDSQTSGRIAKGRRLYGQARRQLIRPCVFYAEYAPLAPCESSSLAPAVRWGGKRKAP